MKGLCALLTLSLTLAAAIVDRTAIAIGHQVVTESQIDEELRITALLNHEPVLTDARTRKAAADRLVQQFLIERETEVNRFPRPDATDVAAYRQQIEQDFGGASNLAKALTQYQLSQEVFLSHLKLQLATMRFIEFRFQPDPAAKNPNPEQQVDEALDTWLREVRKRLKIVYLDSSLR